MSKYFISIEMKCKIFIFFNNKMSMINHAKFFDQSNTGRITREDAYKSFIELKFSKPLAYIGSVILLLLLSKQTGGDGSYIIVENVGKGLHAPNDTGGFDPSYKLVLDKDLYTLEDIKDLIRKRGKVSPAFQFEWGLLLNMLKKFRTLKNEQGIDVISKQEIEYLFDGTLFFRLTGKPIPF